MDEALVLEHREYAESIRASRDTVRASRKTTAFGVESVMPGVEHQEHVHYVMSLQIKGYVWITELFANFS